jgi:hypothetical protein
MSVELVQEVAARSRELVAAGFGVAIVPVSVRAARRPGVAFRAIRGAPRADPLVVWPKSAAARAGLDPVRPARSVFLEVVERVGLTGTRRRLTLRRSRKRANLQEVE